MATLETIGLGGDGDEVDAITAAFGCFGLAVPVEDAREWRTVGDVWQSLQRLLPKVDTQPKAWRRFVRHLCDETGADPDRVVSDTRLLA